MGERRREDGHTRSGHPTWDVDRDVEMRCQESPWDGEDRRRDASPLPSGDPVHDGWMGENVDEDPKPRSNHVSCEM